MNILDIPKVELHRHLELSIRHSTLKDLAQKKGLKIDSPDKFKHHFIIDAPMENLEQVLHKFLDTQTLLSTEDIIERISFEVVEDAFNEGIRILELRYAPTFIVQNHDLNFQQAHDAIVRGIRKAENKYNIAVGLISILQRILSVEKAQEVLDFTLKNKETFVGLDLADNEEGFDSKPFAPLFKKAKEEGLGITVHSGEINTKNSPFYVKDAIEYLGAERIGHGVQAHKSKEMIDYLKSSRIPLELCPTSNWLTQAVPSTKDHPIKKLIAAGVLVTINSDDPGIFNIDLSHEYKLLAEEHGFNNEDFERCNDIAASFSFIPIDKKQKVWPRVIIDRSAL